MFDKSEALQVFRITEAEYNELLKEFVSQVFDKIKELELTLLQKDEIRAANIVHAIKGVSGNMRIKHMHELSIKLEEAIHLRADRSIHSGILKMKEILLDINQEFI